MPKVPIIPLLRILAQFAKANNLQLNGNNFHSIKRVFFQYNIEAAKLN